MYLSDLKVGMSLGNKCDSIGVVRLKTSWWNDKNGLYSKKSLAYLKRKSVGYHPLSEEVDAVGAEDAGRTIINLDECKDGIYIVTLCNSKTDWESGLVESYDLMLVPYNGE